MSECVTRPAIANTLDWRALSQPELDAGLNNSAAVHNSDDIVAGWKRRSAEIRAAYPSHLDLRYGPRERNRIDFLKSADNAPTLVFIHGGYWQFRAKEDFTFTAAGPLARRMNVAFLAYTLAPDASLDDMVSEVHDALDCLEAMLPALVERPGPMAVAGWSAGGHLAVAATKHPAVSAVLSISGVFDLEPIRHSYLNEKLGLDRESARRHSPIHWSDDRNKPVALVVGRDELPLLREQSARYASARARKRLATAYEEIPLTNHFTILDELARPGGRLTRLLARLIEDSDLRAPLVLGLD